jgi:stress response protein SCP2
MPDFLEFDNAQHNLLVGLGWDQNPKGSGLFASNHDVDLACCLLDKDFNLVDFLTPSSPKRDEYRFEILHTGDHKSGESPGEDEELHINLRKLNPDIVYITFLLRTKGSTRLADVKNLYCVFMDGGSYRKFLNLNLKAQSFKEYDNPQFLAAVLKRWTGKTLDGDLWTLKPVEKTLNQSDNIGADFWNVRAAIEEVYKV